MRVMYAGHGSNSIEDGRRVCRCAGAVHRVAVMSNRVGALVQGRGDRFRGHRRAVEGDSRNGVSGREHAESGGWALLPVGADKEPSHGHEGPTGLAG